ncbi:MAG: Fe-S cluster assembly protein SufD [Ignavibacteria bacterium]|nr:Fe-S cluster assembly protein SufD [Ignavibacteria bacterium]
MEKEKTNLADSIIKNYEEFIHSGSKNEISELRNEAINYFREKGFPTRKDEEWRYTNISPLINKNYVLQTGGEEIKNENIKKYLIKGLDANLIVMVNGKYFDSLSRTDNNGNYYVNSLKKSFNERKEIVLKYFSKSSGNLEDSFTALNTAFADDGVLIHISKNTTVDKPFLILNLTGSESSEVLANTRNIIIAEPNSQATVIDLYHNFGNNYSFSNALTEVFVKENSVVKYYKIQNDNEKSHSINTVQSRIGKSAEFDTFVISWGGEILRNNLNSVLEGEGAGCIMKGIYLSDGNNLIDNHTLVDHAVPNCNSNQTYKGILGGNAFGVFNGKILVRKDAQKTNAYQSNKNVLISDTASINAKPQLEIFADDVKCSHGATTGQLNPEELFYLRSRGIEKSEARKLLLNAFLDELILEIDIEPLKIYLEKLLNEKFN